MLLMIRTLFLSAYYRFRMKYTSFAKFSKGIGERGVESSLKTYRVKDLYRVRAAVITVCEHTPWESKCMVQALTAKTILNSIGLPCTLYMGVMNSPDTGEMIAHAWLRCGTLIVTGDGYENYTITGKFGDNFEAHLTGVRKLKSDIVKKSESGDMIATGILKTYRKLRR